MGPLRPGLCAGAVREATAGWSTVAKKGTITEMKVTKRRYLAVVPAILVSLGLAACQASGGSANGANASAVNQTATSGSGVTSASTGATSVGSGVTSAGTGITSVNSASA